MRAVTKKITTAAVCTALCVILCVATAYAPLSIMPLYLAAFCIFLACKRAGLAYGLLCAAASIGIMFAMTGLSAKWFFFLLMFAPYGIIAYFIDKLTYFKLKRALLRVLIVIVFFNVALGCIYLTVTRISAVGLDIDIPEWSARLGGYVLLALTGTVLFIPLDLIFNSLAPVVLKRIPAIDQKNKSRREKSIGAPAAADEDKSDAKYDIFGYEIVHTEADEPCRSESDDEDKPKKNS